MHPLRRLAIMLTRHVDGILLLAVLLLMATGLVVMWSASNGNITRTSGQMINMLVALTVMWLFANVPPQVLQRMALPLFVTGVGLLLCVALFGDVINGARRWLDIGITRIQPSELMRIAAPMALAWYFNRHEGSLRLKHYGIAALMLAIPAAFILRQPDLGTALLITASGAYLIFLAGLPWRVIIALGATAAASAPFLWSAMHDYQRQRVLTLIDPGADPLGSGYHTIQSTIAVGSGGFLGKGWMNGTQTHLDFIPERTTDFIFAVYSEEFGLLGNILLLAMLLLVIGRAMMIAANAPSPFTRLLAGSIAMTFCTYAFVNMGMVSGILPVVGVPLPLISYGGTSMVSICISFGILMSINTHKKLMQT
jgi:rod shape determining protein RodA